MQSKFIHQNIWPATMYQCIVTKVYPRRMSIDVYIPETSTKYQGVQLLSSNIGTSYGSVALPEENSLGIVALYHRARFPIFLGCIPGHGFNSGDETFEELSQGENQNTGVGGSFVKLDKSGNAVIGSCDSSSQWIMQDGEIVSFSKGASSFSNLHRNSLRISSDDDIISLDGVFECRKSASLKQHQKEDFLSSGTVDWNLEQDALKNARSVLESVSGGESIFEKTQSVVQSIYPERSCLESDIKAYEEFLHSLTIPKNGSMVRGEIFGDSDLRIGVYDESDTFVAGIEIDAESGGKLIGEWEWWYRDAR